MTPALVMFENVSKRFGDYTAVRDLSLAIAPGEFVAIMGSSGCGKTTMLRLLAGLERADRGRILLNGRDMNGVPAWERVTPLVWQSLALFPFLNARENVEFGLKMRGQGAAECRSKALAWLDRLGIAELAERPVDRLSGGQRQRVALARALVTEPEILLLDEPLSALDANLVVHMQSVLTRLQKELGITFVYVTHSQSEAFAMADRVVIMSQGSIEQIGTPEVVYRSPASRFVAEFVGTNNIFEATVRAVEGDALRLDSAAGEFTVAGRAEAAYAPGQALTFVVSADQIDLHERSPADVPNSLRCQLVSEQFVGAMVTLYLETSGGLVLRVQKPYKDLDKDLGRLTAGSKLWACWRPQACFILPASEL